MELSLCMIVKNEEKNIDECLRRAVNLVEEIIVIDTGSVDKTKDKAFIYTDKVYDYKWNNDFSSARNFSISKAVNDWILVLDSDEFVTEAKVEKIKDFINNTCNNHIVGTIGIVNIMEDSFGVKKYNGRVSRLFNRNYFKYEGIIHEQLVFINGDIYNTANIDISVEHIGYTKEILNRTNKLKRNIDMLNHELLIKPDDQYILFQLGKSYYVMKDYINSVQYFEKALEYNIDCRLEYIEDLIQTYGYSLINAGLYSKALILQQFIEVYNNADFHFLMGLIYMNNAMFNKAVESFIKCTKFLSCKAEGVNTCLAYYNIGVIYEVSRYINKALEFYNLCGSYEPAVKRIKDIMKNS